jgi:hypothetical protein
MMMTMTTTMIQEVVVEGNHPVVHQAIQAMMRTVHMHGNARVGVNANLMGSRREPVSI